MDTFSFDSVNAELRFSGRVTPIVGWTANLTVEGRTPTTLAGGAGPPPPFGGPIAFEARAMDIIAQLDFMDEFHVWAGRMLTPSDRTNFSGPWFIAPWEYPGVYNVPGPTGGFAYVGPRGTEEIGREVGTVVWGDIGKGKFKYYLGMLDVDDAPANTPLYRRDSATRSSAASPASTAAAPTTARRTSSRSAPRSQYQDRLGSGGDSVTEFNADVLAEFNVGTAGTVGLEGAYYHFDDERRSCLPMTPSSSSVATSYRMRSASVNRSSWCVTRTPRETTTTIWATCP